jgi:hypothetical protein
MIFGISLGVLAEDSFEINECIEVTAQRAIISKTAEDVGIFVDSDFELSIALRSGGRDKQSAYFKRDLPPGFNGQIEMENSILICQNDLNNIDEGLNVVLYENGLAFKSHVDFIHLSLELINELAQKREISRELENKYGILVEIKMEIIKF